MPLKITTHTKPLHVYSKTGVYRGMHFLLIVALKHRLWVHVRTALMRRFLRVSTIFVLSKIKKKFKYFHFCSRKILRTLHRLIIVMLSAHFSSVHTAALLESAEEYEFSKIKSPRKNTNISPEKSGIFLPTSLVNLPLFTLIYAHI